MVLRETCLYCEQKGVETKLVPTTGHWRLCPVCEPGFLQSLTPPTVAEVLARQGMAPTLIEREAERRRALIAYRADLDATGV